MRTFACDGGALSGGASSLRVLRIVEGTSVDGVGLRTSIYGAGCANRCEGCHNPQSWDPAGGEEMSVSAVLEQFFLFGILKK